MEKQGAKRFVIVDQSLKSTLGHFYEYTSTAEQALRQAGYNVEVLASRHLSEDLKKKSGWRSVFSFDWNHRTRDEALLSLIWLFLPGRWARFFLPKLPTQSFGRELQFQLSSLNVGPSDQVLIHTLNFVQLIETMMLTYLPLAMPQFHIILRFDPEENGRGGLKNFLLRKMIRKADRSGKITFYSDTTALCQAYASLSGVSFFRLPILFDETWVMKAMARYSPDPANLTVCYLGDGRSEKGYHLLAPLVHEVLAQTSNVRFLFQSVLKPESIAELGEAQKALRALAESHPGRVVLLEKALDNDDYYDVLAQSQVVLLPYRREAYRMRSSGIQAQGLAFGAHVVVPSGTAMADDCPADRKLVFREFAEIPRLLLEAVEKSGSGQAPPPHGKIKEEFVSALQLR